MACCEIEFNGWTCCCMAKSKDTCKCNVVDKHSIKPEILPTIHQSPKLKHIQVPKFNE